MISVSPAGSITNAHINKMADRLANIAMDTGALFKSEANTVEAATAFLDNDVNHWL